MKKKKSTGNISKRNYSDLMLDSYPLNSRFAEAYRSLRTNIMFSIVDRACRSLLITSAGQKEGKTITAINLAHTLCNAGKSVLMIDGDLRNPTMSRLFENGSSPGIAGLVTEKLVSPVTRGELNGYSPSDLLRLLQLKKKTGTLTLESDEEAFTLVFRQGALVDIQWPARPRERRLAQLLVNGRKLTQDQAKMVLGMQQKTGQRTGEIILTSGMMNRDDLSGVLSAQMLETMQAVLQTRSGRFSFQASEGVSVDTSGFNPVDFSSLHRQAVVGAEKLPFIHGLIRQAVIQTPTPGLHLLPSGGTPPNPSELLGSEQMSFLLQQLQRQFDFIIIDTPPIMPASDGLIIAPQVDGVLLVVKSGHMNRRMVAGTVDSLRMAKANVLGVVLNQLDTRREGYYYYYYQKYYSSYYGEKN